MKKVGEMIRKVRLEKRVTQDELAHQIPLIRTLHA